MADLKANWLGDSRTEWEARISAHTGSDSVSSLLRKHGLPQRLADAICEEVITLSPKVSTFFQGLLN